MSDLPVLSAIDQRILGCLLEKEVTVPSTYPLTLNGLRTACNQTSSRDPVTDYDEREIEHTLSDLKLRRLVRFEHSGAGSRVMKYRQLIAEALELDGAERAVLTVLLLRGMQSAGEVKTRTERLHDFADADAVQVCLHRLAARPHPLVREIPRRPGWRDTRWIHLLGADAQSGSPALETSEPVAETDPGERDTRVVATYDTLAASYADMRRDELERKPFDRWLLERVAELAGTRPIADVGCGPGHVTAHLAAVGADCVGFDVSPGMIAQARAAFPDLAFREHDLRDLPAPDSGDGWGAIVAWYSLLHLTPGESAAAVAALARRLAPDGVLALAVHAGPQVRHIDERWGHDIDIDVVLHDPRTLRAAVEAAGLSVQEWYLRSPLPDVEIPTDRLYVLARRSGRD